MKDSIEKRVIEILAEVMNVNSDEVNLSSSTDTLHQWDSLMHMNLIMRLEEEFDIQFSEEQIVADMLSCQQIVNIISVSKID